MQSEKNKLRFGIIGCGRISINHLTAFLNNQNDLELVALCDLVISKAEKLLMDSKVETPVKLYKSYKEMINEEKLDLVAIATESGKHAEIAIFCLKNKINVIVEKPMALSIDDANEMIAIAKENGVKLCVSHQNRFNKSIRKLREAYEMGKFGKLLYGTAHIRWNRGVEYYEQANWRGTWEQDGGALMNQCIHNIDLLRWMLGGEVEEVFAYTDNLNHPYIAGEDLGLALLKFKNGAYGVIEGTVDVFPQNLEETLYIFGKNGTVKVGGKSVNKIEVWKFADEEELAVLEEFREDPPNVYGFGHTLLYKDMIEAIKKDGKPYIDGEEGKMALEIVLAIYKSAKEGRPVKLPIENFGTLDMKGFSKNKNLLLS